MCNIKDGLPSRRSIRLPHCDYTSAGGYFITICADNRKCIFGTVEGEQMCWNQIGEVAHACWLEIPQHFTNVTLDAFNIMPNHMHGILMLSGPLDPSRKQRARTVGAQNFAPVVSVAPTTDQVGEFRVRPNSVGSIIRAYKAAVTTQCRAFAAGSDIAIWQRNYYEHVIRNEQDLREIREYVVNNPLKWALDRYYVK